MAARASARRIAQERGCAVGAEVGFRVRFENKTSAETRIEVLTEGLLTRHLQADPFLEGVAAVVLDEFHERPFTPIWPWPCFGRSSGRLGQISS